MAPHAPSSRSIYSTLKAPPPHWTAAWHTWILFVGLLCLMMAAALPSALQRMLDERVDAQVSLLSKDSPTFASWSGEASVTTQANVLRRYVYLFDIVNGDEVLAGTAYPALQQRGPYIYEIHKRRFNVTFGTGPHGGKNVTWRTHTSFKFDAQRSAPRKESDVLTTLNIAFWGSVAMLYKKGGLQTGELLALYGLIDPMKRVFTQRNVSELLFGYTDREMLYIHKHIIPSVSPRVPGYYINQTLEEAKKSGLSGMYTSANAKGTVAPRDLFRWRGATSLSVCTGFSYNVAGCNASRVRPAWGTPQASAVQGSMGSQFARPVRRGGSLNTWVQFRHLLFDNLNGEEVDFYGVRLLRHRIAPSALANMTINKENAAYHQYGASGLFNITLQARGIPMFLSKPHFLDVPSPRITKNVTGLNPSPTLHDSFIDVEPVTGTTMHVAVRLQLSIQIFTLPFPKLKAWFPKLRPSLVPVIWSGDEASIDKAQADHFLNTVGVLEYARGFVLYFGVATGAGLVLIGLATLFICRRRRKKQSEAFFGISHEERSLYSDQWRAEHGMPTHDHFRRHREAIGHDSGDATVNLLPENRRALLASPIPDPDDVHPAWWRRVRGVQWLQSLWTEPESPTNGEESEGGAPEAADSVAHMPPVPNQLQVASSRQPSARRLLLKRIDE